MYGFPLPIVPPLIVLSLLLNLGTFHAVRIGRKVAVEAVVIRGTSGRVNRFIMCRGIKGHSILTHSLSCVPYRRLQSSSLERTGLPMRARVRMASQVLRDRELFFIAGDSGTSSTRARLSQHLI